MKQSSEIEEISLFDESVFEEIPKRKKRKVRPKVASIKTNISHEIIAETSDLFHQVSDETEVFEEARKTVEDDGFEAETETDDEELLSDEIIDEFEGSEEKDEDSTFLPDGSIGLGVLFEQANRYKLLTRQEEYEYFKRYHSSVDEQEKKEIKQHIVCCNIRLVVAIAKKVAKVNKKVELQDMIDAGIIGMYKAIEKFDYTKGFKFSTYAYNWIHQTITRSIANTGDTIRIPVHFTENLSKIKKIENQYMIEHGCETVPDEEIAERLGTTVEKVKKYKKYAMPCSSIDTPIDDSDTEIVDMVEDKDSENPEEASVNGELHKYLLDAIKTLDEREACIIINRYNLNHSARPLQLEELAKKFGLTKERIRQIEANALLKLRHPSKSYKFREFY